MNITDELTKDAIIPHLESKTKNDVIKELASHICKHHPNINPQQASEVIMEREKLCSTALDAGVAIPHGKMSGLSNFAISFGKSTEGIDFESLDGKPTHLFILILSPENSSGMHLKLLAKISKIFKIQEFRSKLLNANTSGEIYDIIAEEDAKY
ncbi:MAG: PTS sugar transporter subunit IIA [Candidatus Dadabacteria bacterium]|nr:PTS sugar transporter subunit IIA [Candidatus Dadabacteria bacterium]NIS07248.1 PTS sugar transporter subunit IIA [Candidatus Dadabacteria bacterium]NIV40955.1 PTS transporter subunit EIIA [Candidatus Dadabacteria bacterium]NIX14387.1 PTS transporter subunit EIIA [Candidatus Dadabacteria bacterium]NIY20905.1 PTS transporter subunit EIIA [Candidatus Dadabacteria bacterium]